MRKRGILILDGRFYKLVSVTAYNPNPMGTFVRGMSEFEPKQIACWEFVTQDQSIIEVNGTVNQIIRRTGRLVLMVDTAVKIC